MTFIDFFEELFNIFGGLMTFINSTDNIWGISILQMLGASLLIWLPVVFGLHISHLINPLG